jgi:hypothetical protein
MDTTTNLQLPFIAAAQAQKHVTHNEALRALDAVVQLTVLDNSHSAPPGSPAEGARYIVAGSGGAGWAGQGGKIAAYQDGAWAFYTPREGWLAWVADEDRLYTYTGSAWTAFAGLGNVVEDTSPQLGGPLDANGFNVGFDDATGIADDTGNEQLLFRKTANAVNQISLTNAAAGNAPRIAAEGNDTNINLQLRGKGTGFIDVDRLGINASADTTNRLSLNSPASLFNHAGNGHQVKVNKNAAADTASFLFQTNFSGRAEIGTAGDDNFHVKVSADGSAWTEALVLNTAGNVLVGGTANPASAAKALVIFNGTAPTGSVTDGVVLYAADVSASSELRVRDEAGNVTTLSPHNFANIPEGPSEPMAWAYRSERDGKAISVDMLRVIRLVEKLTGETLVRETETA